MTNDDQLITNYDQRPTVVTSIVFVTVSKSFFFILIVFPKRGFLHWCVETVGPFGIETSVSSPQALKEEGRGEGRRRKIWELRRYLPSASGRQISRR